MKTQNINKRIVNPLIWQQIHGLRYCQLCWPVVLSKNLCSMKEMFVKCGYRDESKKWSLHLLKSKQLSLMCTWKFSGDINWFHAHDLCDTGLQCSYQQIYEATWIWEGQLVGLMCSHERNVQISSSFIAQLVRALHRHRRGYGFESPWSHLKFFSGAHMTPLLKLSSNCQDDFFYSSLCNSFSLYNQTLKKKTKVPHSDKQKIVTKFLTVSTKTVIFAFSMPFTLCGTQNY